MRLFINIFSILFLISAYSLAASDSNMTAEEEQYIESAQKIIKSLKPQHGVIKLPNGVATLNVPDDFYYLGPKDTANVLEKIWGNPPGSELQGMIFPADKSPLDKDAWAVTIDYQEDGYVKDDEADDIDYDDLLSDMQKSVEEENKERTKMGYEAITLVGWASAPYYDKETHKLHWAKEIKFGEQETNTLNYNIRILGRKGVLVLNFIAGMDQLDLINSKLDTVLAMANFNEGNTYKDFNPSTDKIAAYGIGALIAGKLLLKTGLLVKVLIFLKKFWFIFLFGIGALFKRSKE